MNYYWFNRDELLKKARTKYRNKDGKEKAAEYYQKEVIKEKARNKYENLSFEEKEEKKAVFKKSV